LAGRADTLCCRHVADCRLPGPLRSPPLARLVPPTHAEHTLAGGHPLCSACTLGAQRVALCSGRLNSVPLVTRPHRCGLERPNSKQSSSRNKTRKKGKLSPRSAFIENAFRFFADIFSICDIKVVYEASQRVGYFKKWLRENFPTPTRKLWEASLPRSFRSLQCAKIVQAQFYRLLAGKI
jgi:hypothetical protein